MPEHRELGAINRTSKVVVVVVVGVGCIICLDGLDNWWRFACLNMVHPGIWYMGYVVFFGRIMPFASHRRHMRFWRDDAGDRW